MQNVTNYALFLVVSVTLEAILNQTSFPHFLFETLQVLISYKISPTMQPLFVSRKLEQDSRSKEVKPSDVNQQCVVYHFSCDLFDADYVGYTTQHLSYAGGHVREHKHSVIGKHLRDVHNLRNKDVRDQFTILKKGRRKLDCLSYEMLFIKNKKPTLNTQSDPLKQKV